MKHDKNIFKRSMLRTAVRSALAFSVVAGLGVNSAYAAEEEGAEEESKKILITGSRIRRDEFGSPSPIQILKVEDARRAGITTVAELIGRMSLVNGTQIDNTINTNSGNSNATEAPPAGGVGSINVGLRGLGAERTLILLDGRRLGASGVRGAPAQPDLSLIPLDMVERVEVLSDSASAIYGADAVSGVINIILRDSFDGAKVTVNISSPSDPGGEVKQVSFVMGGEAERFKFIFGGEVYDREAIALGDRIDCIERREINATTGEKYNYCYNSFPDNAVIAYPSPGNAGYWNFYTPGSSDIGVANWSSPAGIPDTWSSAFPFLRNDITGNDRFRLSEDLNDAPDRLRSDLASGVKRFSLMSKGTYNPVWGEQSNVEITVDASYFHRHLTNTATAEQIYPGVPAMIPQENAAGNLLQDAAGNLILAPNPLNQFGADVLPILTLDDVNQTRQVELDHFRFSTGIAGDLPGEWFKENGWTFDVSGSYDRGDGVATQPQMDQRNAQISMETLRLDADGNLICGLSNVADGPFGGLIGLNQANCIPIDFLNDRLYGNSEFSSGSLSAAERDFLIGERVNRTVVTQTIFSGFVTGELFDFSTGGTSSLVVGVEARRDTIDSQADFNSSNGLTVSENPATEGITAGARTVKEVFAEISLPILQGVTGAENLTLDLAARYTDESNFGGENTERVRITYMPIDWISLSAAYGTSFRAPNLREQFLGDQFGGTSGGLDPCNAAAFTSGTPSVYDPTLETRSQTTLDNCVAHGADPFVLGTLGTTTIPVRVGGAVDNLLPETAEQFTMTLKADIPIDNEDISFDFAITYFDIDIKNTINSVSPGFILSRCFDDLAGLASPFCDLVGARPANRPPSSAFVSSVDASFVNIGAEVSTGYDFNTRLGLKFDEFDVVWTVQATLQEERSQTIIADAALVNGGKDDFVGTHGTPDWRAVTQILVTFDDFAVAYTGRYIAETDIFIRDPSTSASSCIAGNASASTRITGAPLVYRDCVAESAYTSDISLTWAPEDADFSATVGVSNFTDEAPAQVSSGLGNDRGGRMTGSGYDQVGRSIFAFASYKF